MSPEDSNAAKDPNAAPEDAAKDPNAAQDPNAAPEKAKDESEAKEGLEKEEAKEEPKLKLTIISAKNLPSSFMDTIDPYLKVDYDGQKKESKKLEDNENPEFNEEIEFNLNKVVKTVRLVLMDSNILSDSEVGHIDLDLSGLLQNHEPLEHKDYALLDKDNNQLKKGTLSYKVEVLGDLTPEQKKEENLNKVIPGGDDHPEFTITIKNARNLVSSMLDKIDPYVVADYGGKEERTKAMDNNENPTWDEELKYRVEDKSDKFMKLKVMDSNVIMDTEYAHIMVDLSKMIDSKESIEVNDAKLLDSDKKEIKSTISYTVALVGDKAAEEDKKAEEDKEAKEEQAKKALEDKKNEPA